MKGGWVKSEVRTHDGLFSIDIGVVVVQGGGEGHQGGGVAQEGGVLKGENPPSECSLASSNATTLSETALLPGKDTPKVSHLFSAAIPLSET